VCLRERFPKRRTQKEAGIKGNNKAPPETSQEGIPTREWKFLKERINLALRKSKNGPN